MPADTRRTDATGEFVRRLRRDLPANIIDVRLFGSKARGQTTAESDIDVLVVVEPDNQRAALETRVVDLEDSPATKRFVAALVDSPSQAPTKLRLKPPRTAWPSAPSL